MLTRRQVLAMGLIAPAAFLRWKKRAFAQQPFIPADRLTTWVPGMMAQGGIPDRTTVFTTLDASSFGDGTQEASGAIQAAIDACPPGQVVQLSAGTFLCNASFLNIHSGITLRGAGSGLTTLQKTNGAQPDTEAAGDPQPLVVVGPNRFPSPDNTTSRNLTADGAKGAFSVTVSSATDFAPGQIVLLDERSGASWQPDLLGRGQIWASPDYKVVWMMHLPHYGADDCGASDADGPLDFPDVRPPRSMSWFCRADRPTGELKEIASVAGNVITFTTPLHTDYRASHTGQLTRYTGGNVHVQNAGVERLTVVGGGNGGIRFEAAAYCWAKDCEVTVWHDEGFAVNNCFRVEIRDSYIHDAAWPQPGGAGYAISFANSSAEVLVENCISIRANKVMVSRCAGAGSVFGYNYADAGFINTIEGWIEIGLNASHMVGSHHVLFEGNYGFNFDSDHTHGNSVSMTVFRNHLRGIRVAFVNPHTGDTVDDATQLGNAPRRCIGATGYTYFMNFAGNVLGAPGQMSGFVYDGVGQGAMDTPSIWLLGWDDQAPQPYDPNVAATAIRHGNWDYLQNVVTWDPNNSNHTIPNSLYLNAKPAFFGSNPWPWVDPVGTTKLFALPAKQRLLGGGRQPSPPTNLQIL